MAGPAEIRVKVVGAVPDLPVYADDKAPNGLWCMYGNEMYRLENGRELITVSRDDPWFSDPQKVAAFFNSNGYQRVWLIDGDGHGVDFGGQPLWVESSHLAPVGAPEPEPAPVPPVEGEEWEVTIHVKRLK